MFCKYFDDRIYVIRQLTISICGLLHGMCAGCVLGFTSILLPQLERDSFIHLTKDEESWIASSTTLVMFPATLFAGWALEQFGRKRMALASIFINLSGWLTMYIATNYSTLVLSRILSGIFCGLGYPIFITFVGEVVDPRLRAFFLSLLPLGCSIGVFTCHLSGTFLHWRYVALTTSLIPIYNILVMYFYISESYVWHKNLDAIDSARICFTWFRGNDIRAVEEFNKATETRMKSGDKDGKQMGLNTMRILRKRSFLIPFCITTIAFTTNQFSGNIALLFYTSKIISIITPDPQMQFYATTLLNFLRICATIASCVLVKVISVKRVLTFGGFALTISLLNLAVFLHLSHEYAEVELYSIVCIVSVIANVIFFALSLGPLPSVICGELYPAETRGIGGALSACCSFISLFIVVKLMPIMLSVLSAAGTFLSFAVCTFIGVTILALILPDTRNKTLKEIGTMYQET